ncbi:pyruvate dehydrogenase (acetyl-transferring) E1 component subunit alpha [Lentibacillus halophilus]|uniref:2-oxoisovalerate dehydrogenase subunit alpha n=1 Tax=Lentibacillus halophilus TaxID=295065 RepID=A0ABP3J632_9BACI
MMEKYPLFQIIDKNGHISSDDYQTEITEENVKWLYYHMLRIRTYDRKGVSLQRQGRIGTYVPFYGQEASQVGSAVAMNDGDWLFPTYRDHGASLAFGADMDRMLMHWNGRLEGCLPSRNKHIMPGSIPIATHLPHAVGVAMAETYKNAGNVSIAYFGDGATSEGDFHEGLNMGSTFSAPVVFFNQNNGFAISMPVEKQMNSETIAQKAEAYDIPGIRVDGMDVFAVYIAVKEAINRARNGKGPTLIESVTWRFGAHTTADDPSKYRDQEQMEQIQNSLDPVSRLERYMQNHDLWDNERLLKCKQIKWLLKSLHQQEEQYNSFISIPVIQCQSERY